MPTATPPAEALAAIVGPSANITSRVDIYEADATTLWMANAPLLAGTVSVDTSRDERRNVEMTLQNENGDLDNYPGGFWYDKVIKPYRGVRYLTPEPPETEVIDLLWDDDIDWNAAISWDGSDLTIPPSFMAVTWESQLGEFVIDEISTQHFPYTTEVKGRDYTVKLIEDKLGRSTTFAAATPMETVLKALALNGGITKFLFPQTAHALGKEYAFEAGTTRWEAMTKIATAFGHELFFDGHGYLVLREFQDPVMSPVVATLQTGPSVGNLVTFKKTSNQSRLYNAVDITGEGVNQTPVFARIENNNPASPTSIVTLGRRKVYQYKSAFIETEAQANALAASFLAVYGLESYTINWESLVMFWLEGSDIVNFVDPNPNPGDPSRFLLGDFTIPIGLGTMTSTGRRVQVVG